MPELVYRIRGDGTHVSQVMDQTDARLRKSGDVARSQGDMIAGLGRHIAAAFTVTAAVAAVRSLVTETLALETSYSRIKGLVGLTTAEVGEFRGAVRELSTETALSQSILSDALFTVTSAGFRGAEAMDVLTVSAKASAAGMGDARTFAEALTGAVNAYGAANLSAADAGEILIATARAGNFATEQLAGALGRVTPFASQAQVSFEDVGGSIALLTRVSNDAAAAVTQTAALLRAFVVPTGEATKALAEMNLTAEDVRNSFGTQGLVPTLQMLEANLIEMTGSTALAREQLGRLLGSSEAASAAFQILDADAATLAGTFDAVASHSGIVDEAFSAVAETAQHKLSSSLTDLKNMFLQLGEEAVPAINAIAQAMEGLSVTVERNREFWPALFGWTKDTLMHQDLNDTITGAVEVPRFGNRPPDQEFFSVEEMQRDADQRARLREIGRQMFPEAFHRVDPDPVPEIFPLALFGAFGLQGRMGGLGRNNPGRAMGIQLPQLGALGGMAPEEVPGFAPMRSHNEMFSPAGPQSGFPQQIRSFEEMFGRAIESTGSQFQSSFRSNLVEEERQFLAMQAGRRGGPEEETAQGVQEMVRLQGELVQLARDERNDNNQLVAANL